jgi:hypothetical protein
LLLARAVRSRIDVFVDGGEDKRERLTWPGHLDDTAEGLQAHCHGAGGIGQFFLWLDALVPHQRYRNAAERAACAIAAQRETETRAGICHGVSGTGHFMLDCYQRLGGSQWLAFARECGGRLQRFRIPERPGVYAMHNKGAVSPDLMLGYAGPGSFLLRLANVASASDLIFGPLNNAVQTLGSNARDAASDSRSAPGMRWSAAALSAEPAPDHPPSTTHRKEKTNVGENIAEVSRSVALG